MSERLIPETTPVQLERLADLAVESWRLDRWVSELPKPSSLGRLVAKRLKAFLSDNDVEVVTLEGRSYAPGLAVQVVGVVGEDSNAVSKQDYTIRETITPIITWQGAVIRAGQVLLERKP